MPDPDLEMGWGGSRVLGFSPPPFILSLKIKGGGGPPGPSFGFATEISKWIPVLMAYDGDVSAL